MPRVGEEETQFAGDMALQPDALPEGSVHFCQGPLLRKRHKAHTKINKWKPGWFKVEPGEEHF